MINDTGRDALQPFFTGDSYDTPDNRRRVLPDRLFLNTRWYFVGRYIGELLRGRSLSLRGRYGRTAWAESSYRIFNLMEDVGGRFHIRGMDNIRFCRPPLVFISNHMSTLETFVLPCIIVPLMNITFVVKESLVKHPLFGPVMRSRDPIVVKRENPREDFQTVMARGKELLASGMSVVIFPQSTRSVEFRSEDFNSLGIKLAKTAGVKAMPVAVKTDFWEHGKYLKDLGTIRRDRPIYMAFGEPFSIAGAGKDEHRQTIQFISSRLREWGGKVTG